MTTSEQRGPRHQHFSGSGPSFGGDNNGIINNVLLDAQTKALVQKFAATAPGLAKAIEEAASDGMMSREAIAGLDRVANELDWDVATMLSQAGRNINWDVAESLSRSAEGINKDVAYSFSSVASELKRTVGELDSSLQALREMTGQQVTIQGKVIRDAQELAETADFLAPSPSRGRAAWWLGFKIFCLGSGLGLLGAVLLMSHHLGGWVIPALVATLGVPSLSLLNWFLRNQVAESSETQDA